MSISLNDRQNRFVEEYMIDLNAEQAAIRAGYTEASARRNGHRLLKLPNVRKALDAAMEARARRTLIIQDQVIEELAAIAFCDPIEIASTTFRGPADIARLPERARRLIADWHWDARGHFLVRPHSKLRALEVLGRHLGMFVERARVDVNTRLDIASEPLSATARWLEEVIEDNQSTKHSK